jgi:hypothetical protein
MRKLRMTPSITSKFNTCNTAPGVVAGIGLCGSNVIVSGGAADRQ